MSYGNESPPDEYSPERLDRLDETFDLLADRRRRLILHTLAERDEDRIPFSELVTDVTREDDHADRESVVIDLHHRQLPRLAEAGIVEYDHRTGLVEYAGNDTVEVFLREVSP